MGLINYDCYDKNLRFYAGEAGRKFGINIDGEPWLIKFPKSTKGLKTPNVSYTTSPLSEYLGSHIYSLLDIPVHETHLGIREEKIVVACKDFIDGPQRLTEFRQIKNAFVSPDGETNDGTGSSSDLEEVLEVIRDDSLVKTIEGVNARFWDMFVVDALIGNPDRNNTNWGFISEAEDIGGGYSLLNGFALAPIYDNGNAFFNKREDALFEKRLGEAELTQDAFGTNLSFYTQDIDGEVKHIKPFDYLLGTKNPEAHAAVQRIMHKLDMSAINQLIDDIPSEYEGLVVISDAQRVFYKALLKMRVNDSRKGLVAILES